MKNIRDLKVWQKSHALVLVVYQVTKSFPVEERYGLTSQLRRASISIPSNIAEGCGLRSDRELARYLQIAMGSASEVEYQLLLSHDLNLLDHETYQRLQTHVVEVKRMLASFLQKLRKDG